MPMVGAQTEPLQVECAREGAYSLHMRRVPGYLVAACAWLGLAHATYAQRLASDTAAYSATQCPMCAEWNAPASPVKMFGNTYFVGTRGLSAILITSDAGHVLLDGGLPGTAPLIMRNIRALGFRVEDVKLILNSHSHYDHAGGLAALQRVSHAPVYATSGAAPVIRSGKAAVNDPQHAIALAYPPVKDVRVVRDGETLSVGPTRITAHLTQGHAPGGTTWTWQSCEEGRCFDVVYADSQTPVSQDGFRFTGAGAAAFERGFDTIEKLSCDILLTPHPAASNLEDRLEGKKAALIDPSGCTRYAAAGRERLKQRLAEEQKH
jgi:metallo-beta-lactamase class B